MKRWSSGWGDCSVAILRRRSEYNLKMKKLKNMNIILNIFSARLIRVALCEILLALL